MAAFTSFSDHALERYLKMFGRGSLKGYSPISSGIDNSNYWVQLDDDHEVTEFVLTIMENHSFDEAPFFGKLLTHLHHYGLPVPAPQTTLDGMMSTIFCGKPTFLVKRLPGTHFANATQVQCRRIGEFLAAQHNALSELKTHKPNHYSASWMSATVAAQGERISSEDRLLLETCIELYEQVNQEGLPAGLIHGDLFRDNALFEEDELTGVIDYYRSCEDLLAMDIAIALNDWCRDHNEEPDSDKKVALLEGYNTYRPLNDAESEAMVNLQTIAAARFALTRLEIGEPALKDPFEMIHLARTLLDLRH